MIIWQVQHFICSLSSEQIVYGIEVDSGLAATQDGLVVFHQDEKQSGQVDCPTQRPNITENVYLFKTVWLF